MNAYRRRVLLFAGTGLVALIVLLAVSLATGTMSIPAGTALRALVGLGDSGDVLVVQEFRAPRAFAAIVAGAGLGAAGCVLQRLFRNPLASPDVMGVTGGASLGAVSLLAAGASQTLIPLGALGGGLLAALLLGVFSWGSGLSVTRLVLTGLAVQAALAAAVNLMIVRFPAELAGSALQWTTGSVYGRTWTEVWGGTAAMVLALAVALVMNRRLAVLDLGDDSAGALGLNTSRTRLQLLVLAVVLASLAAALAGPVTFVALAVPHIVRFLTGPPTAVTLALAALTGAVLLLGSDLVVQHLLPVEGLPVGAVTATLGAPWLLVLMLRQSSPVNVKRNS
ncbi:FecCD family ABC transporter permease [Streptomyces acidiscabies]|uniref:Iron ABC transporter permease n=1 Tax=Streptomyces acidiscabies TaxID=42234 RepID=A0AAP6B5I1_9ACTN|nr:iron ABC transporter permease [Streptomyces acidiscabies]MBP5941587.1 iron ABC transporter permease [Streptomyces sp. LBUM 1476]MBZ3912979.1 iron ABC transporter permease [Streptomyces acidiscabies]MDX2958464.1 iron ABC transporter permease [Streptomyces acidiscabies]MDX3021030.1 iron ABC transporter permease [Streptomyces acidiscabies]MDX3794967.1 iron ABC transporter permease [Streptomyces acidiscabies]